jgi:hypothetical protein
MINQPLLDYIKQQLQHGVSKEEIKKILMGNGWDASDVEEGFNTLAPKPIVQPTYTPPSTPVTPVMPITPVVTPISNPKPQSIPNFINPLTASNLQPETQKESFVPPTISPINAQPEIIQPVVTQTHKIRKIIYIVLIVILLGGLGGVAYAYYTGAFVSLPSLVSQSIDSARKATSATYDTTISVDFSEMESMTSSFSSLFGGASSPGTASITAQGSYDSSNTNNKKASSVISINMGAFSLGAEIRILDNTFYGVLTKTPTIAFIPTLSSLQNKWFSIPYKSTDGTLANNPLSSISQMGSSITDKLTADQKEHIYEMTRSAHFVKTVARLSPETVGGVLSYNFTFNLDRDGINAYLIALKNYVNTVGNNDSALSAFDPTSINKSLDQIKDFTGEVWIGRSDKLLHKITLNFAVQPDPTKNEEVKITMVSIFSNWNQPVSITAPDSSVPFQTLLSGLMSSLVTTTQTTVPKKVTPKK